MAAMDRIDGLIADDVTGRHELTKLGLSDRIKPTAVVVSQELTAEMFSKRTETADFVKRYDQAAETLVRDGTQAATLRRFGIGRAN
jgi:polar amino acid transport system substrate-binding protein